MIDFFAYLILFLILAPVVAIVLVGGAGILVVATAIITAPFVAMANRKDV